MHDFLRTPEGLELAAAFPRIAKSRLRRGLLELARAAAEGGEADADA